MNEEQLYAMRHSAAHVLASAIKRKWPEVKLGVGPVIDNGFYYDIELPGDARISEDNFKGLEKEMRKIIAADEQFVHSTKSIDDAIAWAQESGQTYKEELLNDLKRAGTTVAKDLAMIDGADNQYVGQPKKADAAADSAAVANLVTEVGFYTNGDFTDLCRGPHAESTGKIGAFKLMKVSGVYWRGKEENPQMQRVQGVAFATQEELDEYLRMLEEAKARDHRKLGKQLDLYLTSEKVGVGLPLFTARGGMLREVLSNYMKQQRRNSGHSIVWTPHMAKNDLYKTSGHWDKFGDELFEVDSKESSDTFYLKPMNCPHHNEIYASLPRSYRDLPLRLSEVATVYRDEKSGELGGLSRVRSITQDDAHVYATPEQMRDEVKLVIENVRSIYKNLGLHESSAMLSFRDDSDAYLGEQSLWDDAQKILVEVAEECELDYRVEEGEAAFYGPKIDFMVSDALGREHQAATVQYDFVQPERFGLQYIAEDGTQKQPLMVHSAWLGSVERFLSVYIEHTNGWFPFWLAPEQIRLLTINNDISAYVDEITSMLNEVVLMHPLRHNEVRYSVDDRNESLSKKIKSAQNLKVPIMIIVGPKDAESRTVSMRVHGIEEQVSVSIDGLVDWLQSFAGDKK